ncbi:MAG TPA: glycosyltransferase family 1 protein [Micavibrio sp.]|nr:glycosyltransferase family 1 protein [Micavibrio sp.]
MKILIVSDAWHPQVNGVVRTYEYLCHELLAMGHTVKIIGPPDFPRSFPMPGYNEIMLVPFPYNRLCRMIADFEPELLHIATEGPLGLAARRYAKKNGMKFTSCYHTHFPDYAAKRVEKIFKPLAAPVRKVGIAFVRWFHKISSCVFIATQSLEDTLREWGFKTPLKRMTRGIDHDIFHTGEKNLFAGLPRPVALYVGRVAVEKNLDAFLSMEWGGSKVVVGNGPCESVLKEKYPAAHFVGVKTGKELADHYRSADLFVFPSRTDTFGMVLVEAMACGLPIAAYPVTGPADIVTQDFLGSLDGDLARACETALKSPGSAEDRAEHARENYSWHMAVRQFLEMD